MQFVGSICSLAFLVSVNLVLAGCVSAKLDRDDAENQGSRIVPSEFSRSHAEAVRLAGRNSAAVLDENSVPHLYAKNRADLFFSQGYAHAFFRLWQMEAGIRLVEGTISEVIGRQGIEFDKFSFYMGFNELARRIHKTLGEQKESQELVENYLAGVHARLDQLDRDPNLLSSEFRSRGIRPRRISSLDIVRLGFARSVGQFDPYSELRLSLSNVLLGKEMFDQLFPWPSREQIPLPLFNDTPKEVGQPRQSLPAIAKDEFPIDELQGTWIRGHTNTGSNAWTHAPSHTVDGFAYLANDFHVHFRLPGLYFPMRMSTPEMNFVGGSIAGQPGFLNGTNGKVALGFVASMADSGDWYRLKMHPNDPSKYRWNGRWESFQSETRIFRILGEKPISVTRRSSKAGRLIPALRGGAGRGKLVELVFKWSTFAYTNPFHFVTSLFDLSEAKDCGKNNLIENIGWLVITCIDAQGRSGYWLSGHLPKRNNQLDPRVLQWAEKDDDIWTDVMPVSLNSSSYPAEAGWPLANQLLLSNKVPQYLGWNFSPPFRAMTLKTLLANSPVEKWKLSDIVDLQSNITDERMKMIKGELLRIASTVQKSNSGCAKTFVDEIRKWNGEFRPESVGATLITTWLRYISLELARVWYGEKEANHAEPFSQWQVVNALLGPKEEKLWKVDNGAADKDVFVRGVLRKLCQSGFRELAGAPERFRWGRINSPVFSSLSGKTPKETSGLEVGGSSFSLFSQGGDHGTNLRAVMKVKNPPEYYFAAPDGPSGDPESPLSSVWTKKWESRTVMPIVPFSASDIENHHGK